MTDRRCKWRECRRPMLTQRADAEFCSDSCRSRHKNEERRKQAATTTRVNGQGGGVGSRGGNVRNLDEARGLQEEQREKARWTLIVREQIARTLLETGYFHADDLDPLGVPPEHCNVKGSQIGSFRSRGLMEKTGAERKVAHAAANGRKAPIYRITQKGREKLAGISAGVPSPQGTDGLPFARLRASTDSGEKPNQASLNREGTAGSHIPGTLDRPETPSHVGTPSGARSSYDVDSGDEGSSAGPQPVGQLPVEESAREPEPLTLLPEPDPEAWAA
jgi:hypothetical protein